MEREAKRICHRQSFLKSMAKGICLNRKAMIKEEGILEHQERERTQREQKYKCVQIIQK